MVVVRGRLVVGVGATVVVVVVVDALVLPLPDVSLRETSPSSTMIGDVLLGELTAGVRSSTATLLWKSGSRRLKGSCITLGSESNGEGT